jgi:hypothetical protein
VEIASGDQSSGDAASIHETSHQMRPGNRYAREAGIGRALGEMVSAKMALVAVCRRCKHRRVLYPANLIARYGEHCPAIELRPHLHCSGYRVRFPCCNHPEFVARASKIQTSHRSAYNDPQAFAGKGRSQGAAPQQPAATMAVRGCMYSVGGKMYLDSEKANIRKNGGIWT